MASAGPYATLHLAPDRQPRQHPTTQFFTGRMPFLPPNQQRQSTEGNSLRKIKRERSRVRRSIADSQRPDTRGSSSIRVRDRRLLCSDATRRDATRRATQHAACAAPLTTASSSETSYLDPQSDPSRIRTPIPSWIWGLGSGHVRLRFVLKFGLGFEPGSRGRGLRSGLGTDSVSDANSVETQRRILAVIRTPIRVWTRIQTRLRS